MSETSTLVSYSGKISRAELAQIPTPPATPTHIPILHSEVVDRKPLHRSTMGSMERMLGTGIGTKACARSSLVENEKHVGLIQSVKASLCDVTAGN